MAAFTPGDKANIRCSFYEGFGQNLGKIQLRTVRDLGITFAILYAYETIRVATLFLNEQSPGTDKDARLTAANLFLKNQCRVFEQMPATLQKVIDMTEPA